MNQRASAPTRVAADIAASAASVAPLENRTVTEQINYWLRLGMQAERASSVESRRVLAVIAGDEQFSTLTPYERTAAHATIDARLAERTAAARFGPAARRAGQVTVSIDDDGTLVELARDGSRRAL